MKRTIQDFERFLTQWETTPHNCPSLPSLILVHRTLIAHAFIVDSINIAMTSVYYICNNSPWKIRLSDHNPGKNWKNSAIFKTIRYDDPACIRIARTIIGNHLNWLRKHPNYAGNNKIHNID